MSQKVTFPEDFWWGAAMSGPQMEGTFEKPHENVMDYWYRTSKEEFFLSLIHIQMCIRDRLTPEGNYYNFSGCGNSLNCNHPVVQQMILECLRHWTVHYRVDGFRFDLASILGRDEDGMPMNNPPLLRSLAYDPLLKNVKLIAEAWDAGGLYQVGNFPASKRWAEWNGQYRDTMRGYLKGDFWEANSAAWRICGSGDLYGGYYSKGNNNYA